MAISGEFFIILIERNKIRDGQRRDRSRDGQGKNIMTPVQHRLRRHKNLYTVSHKNTPLNAVQKTTCV